MWYPPTLMTDRLILRSLSRKDVKDIFSYAHKPIITQFTLWAPHKTLADSKKYIDRYVMDYYREGVPEPFGIIDKMTNQLIGTVGCFWVSKQNKSMELTYVLSDKQWGKGIMVEASLAVIDYCFKLYGLQRIQCQCKAENIASYRVMEKLGMVFEGVLNNELFHRDCYWDMRSYSLLKKEWLLTHRKTGHAFIRKAENGDEKGIHYAHMKSIQEICVQDYTPQQIAAWGKEKYNFKMRNKMITQDHVWVVELNGEIEGYGHLFIVDKEKHAEVMGLYLTPKVIGLGLGQELLFYIKEMAKVLGAHELYLSSTKTSKRFYEKHGFMQYEDNKCFSIAGVEFEGHPMRHIFS